MPPIVRFLVFKVSVDSFDIKQTTDFQHDIYYKIPFSKYPLSRSPLLRKPSFWGQKLWETHSSQNNLFSLLTIKHLEILCEFDSYTYTRSIEKFQQHVITKNGSAEFQSCIIDKTWNWFRFCRNSLTNLHF